MSSTPRSKPLVAKDGHAPSPRASKPKEASGDKKPKAKKPKGSAPTAPVSLGMPMSKASDLTEEQAKADLEALQKKYGALIVNFNNQQAELAKEQKHNAQLEREVESLKAQIGGPSDAAAQILQDKLTNALQELRAVEASNMTLQKKVNKLQVEHVSEEEVDQLFYALEVKEHELEVKKAQLEQAKDANVKLEEEVLTARQLTARGGNQEPKFIEIHHHNDISDDDSDGSDTEGRPAAPAAAPATATASAVSVD